MEKIKQIKQLADQLRLTLLRNQADNVIHLAQIDKHTYIDYTHNLLEREVLQRQKNYMERRKKLAHLPRNHNLDN